MIKLVASLIIISFILKVQTAPINPDIPENETQESGREISARSGYGGYGGYSNGGGKVVIIDQDAPRHRNRDNSLFGDNSLLSLLAIIAATSNNNNNNNFGLNNLAATSLLFG